MPGQQSLGTGGMASAPEASSLGHRLPEAPEGRGCFVQMPPGLDFYSSPGYWESQEAPPPCTRGSHICVVGLGLHSVLTPPLLDSHHLSLSPHVPLSLCPGPQPSAHFFSLLTSSKKPPGIAPPNAYLSLPGLSQVSDAPCCTSLCVLVCMCTHECYPTSFTAIITP